jgi:hypothetical protein
LIEEIGRIDFASVAVEVDGNILLEVVVIMLVMTF